MNWSKSVLIISYVYLAPYTSFGLNEKLYCNMFLVFYENQLHEFVISVKLFYTYSLQLRYSYIQVGLVVNEEKLKVYI